MSTGETKHGKMKMKWTPEEDKMLYDIIMWHGPCHWDGIALHLKGRNGKQCRERWVSALCPNIKKDEWTEEEDKILLVMQSKLGNQWSSIMKYLPGRSAISLKNRFKSLKRHGVSYETFDSPDTICKLTDIQSLCNTQNITESPTEQKSSSSETVTGNATENPVQIFGKTDFYFPIKKRIRLFI